MTDDRIRILYWVTDLTPGGTLYSILHLLRGLDPARFHAALGGFFGGEKFRREYPAVPFRVLDLDLGRWQVLRAVRGIRGAIRLEQPHILHTFLFHANVLGRLAARREKVPAVVSSLRVAEGEKRHHLWLDRWTHRFSDLVLCNSEGVKSCAVLQARVPERKIRVISNGVDASLFDPAPPSRAETTLFSHGRLHLQKGYDVLLRALALLGPKGPRRVRIAGEGPERAPLERLARSLGLSERVEFLGRRHDVAALLREAHVFVLPSRWEGMSNSLLEAMAAGRPIVASDVEGVRDLLRPGGDGLLFPPGDEAALAAAIRELLENPEAAWRMGAGARARVESEFTIEKMVRAHEENYTQLLFGKGVAGKPDRPR